MSSAQRAEFGKAGMTAEECNSVQIERAEREIQKEIGQYLRLLGIEFINPPMNKRSQLPTGWPDFTFAYRGHPIALEVKVPGEKPRPEQSAVHERLFNSTNGWMVFCVHSVATVKDLFRAIDRDIVGTKEVQP